MKENQSLERLKRVSDGIFVLAMMLMVLQFDLPDIEQKMSVKELKEFLFSQLPALYIYLGTFILIAFYWLSNLEQFKHYQQTNSVHLWLNLFSLMFVVVIPYTNDLSNLYPLDISIQIFYSINLFLVGLFSCLSWWYGTNNYRLINPKLDRNYIIYVGLESIIEPIVCLLTIPVSFINPSYWDATFYLIIPAYIFLNIWNKNKTKI